MLKILIACETSGRVRDAFIRAGHLAMSCDLLPTEKRGPHYQGNIFDLNLKNYDLMIAHPPCTYLCSSGLHWNRRRPGRSEKTDAALNFVSRLMSAPVPMIAIENPVGCISTRIQKPTQIIQPWQFGDPESKTTCLWLKNLPKLKPTDILEKPASGRWRNQTASGQNKLSPGPNRWKERSKTYLGIANAMAAQWGKQ